MPFGILIFEIAKNKVSFWILNFEIVNENYFLYFNFRNGKKRAIFNFDFQTCKEIAFWILIFEIVK